jgi:hypothetical protein
MILAIVSISAGFAKFLEHVSWGQKGILMGRTQPANGFHLSRVT